jgi:hypothetical protein
MNRRLTRWLLALYPRYWRDRYGPEVASLNEELINAGETTRLRAGLGMIAGAAIERGRALAGSRQAVMASVLAAIIAVAGLAFGLSNARSTSQAGNSASLACAFKAASPRVYVQLPPGNWKAANPPGFTATLKPAQIANTPVTMRLSKVAAALKAKARRVTVRVKRPLVRAPQVCGFRQAIVASSKGVITWSYIPVVVKGGSVSVILPSGARNALHAAKAASRP